MNNKKKNDTIDSSSEASTASQTTEATLTPRRAAKRVIAPLKQAQKSSLYVTSTEMILNDAKCIIAAELARYRDKAIKGISLDLKEARVVSNYLSELTKLQKEEREQARSEDLSNLSDDELLQLASQVLNTNKLIE